MTAVLTGLWDALAHMWGVAARMSPYLLLGFLMAGVLSVLISPALVERHLGRRGWPQVLKAALFGVPIPLCSCGVIPVATALRRHGASRGATLSFLASTPQTGIDSIMVTQGMLGTVFTVFRVLVAFVSGILCGLVDELFDRSNNNDADAAVEVAEKATPDESACCAAKARPVWLRILRHGFIVLPRDVGGAVLLGIVLSGALAAFVPDNFFADRLPPGILSMLLMMIVGIPLYACSTGSVPLALTLIHMGISPGAALVFLVSGPATNAATVTTLWRVLGRRATVIYLGSIAACALVAGALLDRMVPRSRFDLMTAPTMEHASWWVGTGSAVLLGIILVAAIWSNRRS